MTKSTRVTFVQLVVVLASVLLVWVVAACNGILGNEVLTADAGFDAATPVADTGPAERCPGQKYCSAIDSCGSKSDPSFGCASQTCEPCHIENATAKCGGKGCAVNECFPGFHECVTGTCSDFAEPATCGKCGPACAAATPFCAAAPSTGVFSCVATCPGGQQQCGTLDRCFDLTKSVNHCGDCAIKCSARGGGDSIPSCVGGKCQLTCLAGSRMCGPPGMETCERVDSQHCGPSCTTVCPTAPNSTPTCTEQNGNYTCNFTCNTSKPPTLEYQSCPGVTGCVDIATDLNHCGACNKKCAVPLMTSGAVGGPCTCAAGVCGGIGCKLM